MIKNKYIAPEIEVTNFTISARVMGTVPGDGNIGEIETSERLPSEVESSLPFPDDL